MEVRLEKSHANQLKECDMSVLEKIQNALLEELSGCAELARTSITSIGRNNVNEKEKSLSKIQIMPPLPLSVAKNAECPLFEEVLIQIKITVQKNTARTSESIFSICETICKKLHNKKLGIHQSFGKILLAKSKPWEFSTGNSELNMTINFHIQSVKL